MSDEQRRVSRWWLVPFENGQEAACSVEGCAKLATLEMRVRLEGEAEVQPADVWSCRDHVDAIAELYNPSGP